MSRQNPGFSHICRPERVTGPGGDEAVLNRWRFLGTGGAAVPAVSRADGCSRPQQQERQPPTTILTTSPPGPALAGKCLTLRTASEQETVMAQHPVKGVGRAYTVVLEQEAS